MRLSTKLSLSMGTLVLGAVFIGVFSLFQMNKINAMSTEISRNWLPSTVLVQRINTITSDYRIYEINHIVTEDPAVMKDYENKIASAQTAVETAIKAYRELLFTEEEKRIFSKFMTDWAEYQALSRQIMTLSRDMKTREAEAILNGTSRQLFLDASAALLEAVNYNVEGGKRASAEGDSLFAAAQFMVTFALCLVAMSGIGLCMYIVRDTFRSLGKDPAELQIIAKRVSAGNLDARYEENAVGVFAEVQVMVANLKKNMAAVKEESERAHTESARAQEAMKNAEASSREAQSKTNSMLEAAARLEEVASVVSSASAELSAQIEQSERGAAEQASRVTETATAMEEMNSTVLEVARNAGSASDASSSTRDKAEAGARVVQQAVESIQQVQRQSTRLRADMAKLDENARAISQIMGVISDIADQTNLLALNAAIEAARAGEAGRGFAVVADEVRKLAEKTMASTTDVGNAISAIQQSATESVKQVDESVTIIEQATALANQSGVALSEIVSMVDATADQVRAIATAAEQQSSTSDEITRSISHVSTIASETARAMAEAAKAVSDMSGQAHVLSRLIVDMKH